MKQVLLILLLSFQGAGLFGQLFGLPHLERHTSSSGLSNNSIMDIHQDKFGFLWVATADGLNRYDGYEFTTFQHHANDSTSLADNWLHALSQTRTGELLVGTQKGGVSIYNQRKGTFTNLHPKSLGIYSDHYLNLGKTLLQIDEETIWLGMTPGIIAMDLSKDTSFYLVAGGGLGVNCFIQDQAGNIWVGTNQGLLLGSAGSDGAPPPFEALPHGTTGAVHALTFNQKGQLIVGADQGVFILQEQKSSWEIIEELPQFKEVNSIVCDNKGRVWIGGRRGLSVLEEGAKTMSPKAARLLHENRLDRRYINVLYLDRENNLWIGTTNNGLLRLFLSDQHFPLFRPKLQENDAGSTTDITSAHMDPDGTIWLGTYGGGLLRFDRENGHFDNYTSVLDDPSSLSDNTIYSIFRDADQTLWVGCWNGRGLNEVIEEKESLRFRRAIQEELPDDNTPDINHRSVQQLFEDEYQNLWVAVNSGIFLKRRHDKTFRHIYELDLPFNSINHILEDKNGNWWIGTWHGLFVFNAKYIKALKQGQAVQTVPPDASFYADQDEGHGLTNNRITCLHRDKKDRIWIGTYGGGLMLWEDRGEGNFSGNFKTYGQKDGLPNDVIYGILEDEQERLWLSTNDGLVLFDPRQEVFQVYTEADGLQSNQFNLHAYSYTPSGEFIFGGVNGFNVFDPLQFSTDTTLPPKVLLTDVLVKGEKVPIGKRADGTVVLEEDILQATKMTLQPYDNSFKLSFAAPSFTDGTKMQYAHRLEGFDGDWQKKTHRDRHALYSNLYHGNYTFEVKASIDGKNWGPSHRLEIQVAPPWYLTWWAYTLAILLVFMAFATVAGLSYVYSNLQNKLKLEQLSRQKEAETNEMRMWFFTYISHEFRTPLTLIISPLSEMINDLSLPSKVRDKLRMTYTNSKRLLRLVKQILNFRMINSDQLKLKATENDLVAFTNEVFSSFSSHAESRNIKYHFRSSKRKLPLWFDEEKMELILYNLLSNAFKYSNDGGNILVKIIDTSNERVHIEIIDNGIGIPEDHLPHIFDPFYRATNNQYTGSGIGLALVKNLVEFHHGSIEVNSKANHGSTFRIELKKGNEHFSVEERLDLASKRQVELGNLEVEPLEEGVLSPATPYLQNASKEKLQLLLIEDNAPILKYFRQHFEEHYRILEAQNGEEGLRLAQKHIPDLIISDIMMPKLDGLSLCRKLKENIETSHIPVILLTARTALSHQLEGFESGAFEYITKPVNITVLKSRVFALTKNMLQLRAHYKHQGIIPPSTNHSTVEEKFLLRAAQCVEARLKYTEFNAQDFALAMGISRSGLHRKLQALTGKSATQFIRYIRLKHAEKLLREGQTNISQTAYEVGFNDLKYFRKCFKAEFNMAPSAFLKEVKAG